MWHYFKFCVTSNNKTVSTAKSKKNALLQLLENTFIQTKLRIGLAKKKRTKKKVRRLVLLVAVLLVKVFTILSKFLPLSSPAFFFRFEKFSKTGRKFWKNIFFYKNIKKKKKKGIFLKFSKNFITSQISEFENRKISSGKPEKEKHWSSLFEPSKTLSNVFQFHNLSKRPSEKTIFE